MPVSSCRLHSITSKYKSPSLSITCSLNNTSELNLTGSSKSKLPKLINSPVSKQYSTLEKHKSLEKPSLKFQLPKGIPFDKIKQIEERKKMI